MDAARDGTDAIQSVFREQLQRMSEAAERWFRRRPAVERLPPATPTAIAAASEALGVELPSELVAFYRTTNGLAALGHGIVPIEGLVALQNEIRADLEDIEVSGLTDLVRGPAPTGRQSASHSKRHWSSSTRSLVLRWGA